MFLKQNEFVWQKIVEFDRCQRNAIVKKQNRIDENQRFDAQLNKKIQLMQNQFRRHETIFFISQNDFFLYHYLFLLLNHLQFFLSIKTTMQHSKCK